MSYDVQQIRNDFPILQTKVNGKPLIYFDNGATTQKPRQVINRIVNYYENENSNVHRGVHFLSQLATDKYENARQYVADFIHATESSEIVFTKGTTEGINIISSYFAQLVSEGDEVLVSAMEHHSNLVPWQQLCLKKKAKLVVIPVLENGALDIESLQLLLNNRVKIIAVAHISNVLGTINPVREIVSLAHKNNIPVLVDGAQALAHKQVNVKHLDCDFYVFSSHKAYGPMGSGVLYAKSDWLQKMTPYQYGGEMVQNVNWDQTTYNIPPFKFEAGTPNVSGAVGLEEALKYISATGIENIAKYEDQLLKYAELKMKEIDGIRILGHTPDKAAIISFVAEGVHPYDLGTLLDQMGVAVRTGFHCAQPLIESYGLKGVVRASMAMYNTVEEVDIFIDALLKSLKMLR